MATANEVWHVPTPDYTNEGHPEAVFHILSQIHERVTYLQDALLKGEGYAGPGDGEAFWNGVREIVKLEVAKQIASIPKA